ncbi:Hypothetical protein ETEE_3781 [Edwardsiella anguillarum ET080813]|uniref:Uncharacterized protein n=1 Tax=Edwardsiella anguillarum ET080813 TaxID=667120 RepID=A0A076LUQ9_9GAMM|nr:Hypothetical protein ETEE_3781 [Edwardsiella anguillarum ET080813]
MRTQRKRCGRSDSNDTAKERGCGCRDMRRRSDNDVKGWSDHYARRED